MPSVALPAWLLGGVLLLLAGCSGTPERDSAPTSHPVDLARVPDAVPKVEPRARYGNPQSYVVHGRRYHVKGSSAGYRERGVASWYGRKFHGRRTSSGEVYDMYRMTAAHRSLPLPTFARVTNLENGRQVVLRINDRGPFHDNRLIDLSYVAAWKLGILAKGTGFVEVEAIDPRAPAPPPAQVAKAAAPNGAQVRMYLQTGSFSNWTNAERLKGRIAPVAARPIEIQPAVVAGRTTYRVRVGPIDDVDEADRLAQRLTELGLETPRIVVE
ncbi:MAG: septal ring lytic transglycosylase RlpA family protein [Gammaproteobacteria bacterium]|nr:septal ring lytic transglycosylase RlpA family protein [Gammaproteobacteria bacterium]